MKRIVREVRLLIVLWLMELTMWVLPKPKNSDDKACDILLGMIEIASGMRS